MLLRRTNPITFSTPARLYQDLSNRTMNETPTVSRRGHQGEHPPERPLKPTAGSILQSQAHVACMPTRQGSGTLSPRSVPARMERAGRPTS